MIHHQQNPQDTTSRTMQLFHLSTQLRDYLRTAKAQGKTVGLVPTMGALHDGHLSLMQHARECDVVVTSVFVNPLQFNKKEDLENYPRDLEGDLEQMKGYCDVVFAPDAQEMYPTSPKTTLSFGNLENTLEGEFRPGHFAGVGTVVSKFFHIVQPDKAYFGLKDLQQYLIIKQLVADLSFPIQIVGCPIVREASGLAMSSRNRRLSAKGLATAAHIFMGLQAARQSFQSGQSAQETKKSVQDFYASVNGLEIEYFELVNEQMEKLGNPYPPGPVIACVAAVVEGVRLIDNLYLRSE